MEPHTASMEILTDEQVWARASKRAFLSTFGEEFVSRYEPPYSCRPRDEAPPSAVPAGAVLLYCYCDGSPVGPTPVWGRHLARGVLTELPYDDDKLGQMSELMAALPQMLDNATHLEATLHDFEGLCYAFTDAEAIAFSRQHDPSEVLGGLLRLTLACWWERPA